MVFALNELFLNLSSGFLFHFIRQWSFCYLSNTACRYVEISFKYLVSFLLLNIIRFHMSAETSIGGSR